MSKIIEERIKEYRYGISLLGKLLFELKKSDFKNPEFIYAYIEGTLNAYIKLEKIMSGEE